MDTHIYSCSHTHEDMLSLCEHEKKTDKQKNKRREGNQTMTKKKEKQMIKNK